MNEKEKKDTINMLRWLDYEFNITEGFDNLEQMSRSGRYSYYYMAKMLKKCGIKTLEEFWDEPTKKEKMK